MFVEAFGSQTGKRIVTMNDVNILILHKSGNQTLLIY